MIVRRKSFVDDCTNISYVCDPLTPVLQFVILSSQVRPSVVINKIKTFVNKPTKKNTFGFEISLWKYLVKKFS